MVIHLDYSSRWNIILMRLLLYSLFLFFCSNVLAQTETERAHFYQSAPPGSTYEKPRIKSMYRFPSFSKAEVILQNGDTATGLFNYSISMDQMHFIGEKNDTLYVTDPLAIKFIQLGEYRFYYYKDRYFQTLFITSEIVLAFRQIIIIPRTMPSGFGYPAIYREPKKGPLEYYTSEGQKYNLLNDRQPLNTHEYYYFGDKFGNFFRADKKFIYDHYPKYQEQIRTYIKTNHIYFDNPDSIISLLKYCTTLDKLKPMSGKQEL